MCINKRGVSLIALVVTVIVLAILSITIINLISNGNIFERTNDAVYEKNKNKYKEKIALEISRIMYKNLYNKNDFFNKLAENLEFENATYKIEEKRINITIEDKYSFSVLLDGSIIEGDVSFLDISDGDIQIKQKGYIQGTNQLVENKGKYIITGTTTEYVIEVMEEGTYDITLKNLNIDVSAKSLVCAFRGNAGQKKENCNVNIFLEGDNYLISGGNAPGLAFTGALPNTDTVSTGSTLTINGNGKLFAQGGSLAAGIGSGYGYYNFNKPVANLIINGGNITAKAGNNACAIGGGLRGNVNSITINGGNITAIPSSRAGIGTCANMDGNYGVLEKLTINGGTINSSGGEYGGGIGAANNSGTLIINGGIINSTSKYNASTIGRSFKNIIINGGTINCFSKSNIGIGCEVNKTELIEINGGNIYINAGGNDFSIQPVNKKKENVYLTTIELMNESNNSKINNIKFSDNTLYGINDNYLVGNKLYYYLPIGKRNIQIKTNTNEYNMEKITQE